MKKTILYLILLFSTSLFSQFQTSYTPLEVCDNNNDGFAIFNLTTKIPEILGSSSPNDYNVYFYQSMVDASTSSNPISNPSTYVNITPNIQTIYIGIVTINTNAVSVATMDLIVNPKPLIQTQPMTSCFIQGLAGFDLGLIAEQIWANNNSTSDFLNVTFHLSENDAVNQDFPLPYYYSTQNPTTQVFINATNTLTGCFSLGMVTLIAENCGGVPCSSPLALSVNNVTTTSAVATWTSNSPVVGFEYIVLPQTAQAPSPTVTGFTSVIQNQTTVTGLAPNTCYKVYVRSVCSQNQGTQTSQWSAGWNFCTLPDGTACGGTFTDNGGPNGDYANNSNVVTTYCPNNSGEVVTVSFDSFNTEANWDGMYVYNGNSVNAPLIPSTNTAGNGGLTVPGAFWGTAIPGPFTSSATNGCLTFKFLSDGSVARAGWVANITCGAPSTCFRVNQVTASSITTTSATISWTNPNTATNFEVLVLPQGSPAPTANATGFTTTTTNPYVLAGLQSGSCFSVYIRVRCSTNDASTWSVMYNFCTLFAPPVCGGNFTDNGGITNDYANNSNTTTTICPSVSQQIVTVTFSAFDTEVNWDALYVYDGESAVSPLIASQNGASNVPGGLAGGYWGTEIPGPFTSSNPNGCLTFVFRSDNSVSRPGWVANVTCDIVDRVILHAFLDANNNGIKDTNEPSFNHGSFMVEADNLGTIEEIYSPEGYHIITDENGTSSFDINYQIQSEYGSYFSAGATSFNDISIPIAGGTQTLYFPITLTQAYSDVAVTIIPINAPRAGITNYKNEVVVSNLGTQTIATTTLNFTKSGALSIANVSDTGATITPTGFTRTFTNLLPNESRSIVVNMIVPSIPTVSIGQIVTNTATVSPPSNDLIASNNTTSMSQPIVAAYDPNDKMESHGGRIQFDGFTSNDYLNYTIRFENTGNINAIDVKITDLLDNAIDETSVRMLSTSHPYLLTRTGSNLVWDFVDIQLPVSIPNTQLGKGYISFKVKLKPGFAIGDIIPNTASIFFDSNPAIVTNTFNTEFVQQLSNTTFKDGNVIVYPNPASTMVQVALNNSTETIDSIVVYDLLGKEVLRTNRVTSNEVTLNTSTLSKGIYMLEISSTTNVKLIKKLIIQ